jgi:AcrR family transcriptional regulator
MTSDYFYFGVAMARKQKEKSKQTQDELMLAAVELFGEKGYVATTINEITKNAGYAKGNFYRYWNSKDELFLSIMEKRLKKYRLSRDESLENATSLEEVIGGIHDFLGTIIDDRNWSKVFLEFTIHASYDEKIKENLNKSVYRLSNDIFAEIVKDFVDSDFPPEKLGALNTALFEGFLIHNILGTDVLDKNDLRNAAITLATALGKRSPE